MHASCAIIFEDANSKKLSSYLLICGGIHEESSKSVELYSCLNENSLTMPSLNKKRSRHSVVSIKAAEGNSMSKCYVFSEDSIEFLDVNIAWTYVKTA
jgi:hypothetical protein